MDKEIVDKTITEYLKKIYGFALTKTMNIDHAEELASRITFEVYFSLLKSDNIFNIDGYIYRIACNNYARFIREEMSGQPTTKNSVGTHSCCPQMSDYDETFHSYVEDIGDFDTETQEHLSDIKKDEAYAQLRSEISYLSKLQREIVLLHYFQKLPQKEIAKKLNISLAKVKWHLYEAKNQIKEGFKYRETVLVSEEPALPPFTRGDQGGMGGVGGGCSHQIKFTDMLRIGDIVPNSLDMAVFFPHSLTQNIAYSTYHKPKTALEIARELEVPLTFIEDEISHLVDNGFIDKLPKNKYLTNMYIIETKSQADEIKINKILTDYAETICDLYMPILFKKMKDYLIRPTLQEGGNPPTFMGGVGGDVRSLEKSATDADSINASLRNGADSINASLRNYHLQTPISSKIYYPQNDFNFLMWSIVSFAFWKKFSIQDKQSEINKFKIKRIDDCNFIASTVINRSSKFNNKYYREPIFILHRELLKNIYPMKLYAFSSDFSPMYENSDFLEKIMVTTLYDFITGKITKDPANIDEYVMLFQNDSIVSKGGIEYVNKVVTTFKEDELNDLLPPLPDELVKLAKKYDNEICEIDKIIFPDHKRDLCRVMNLNSISMRRTHIFEALLKKGFLKPVKKKQRKTVNMILFSDVLPEHSPISNHLSLLQTPNS